MSSVDLPTACTACTGACDRRQDEIAVDGLIGSIGPDVLQPRCGGNGRISFEVAGCRHREAHSIEVGLGELTVARFPAATFDLFPVDVRTHLGGDQSHRGATVAAGAGVLELGIRYATCHWRRSEPEIYAAVIPTS